MARPSHIKAQPSFKSRYVSLAGDSASHNIKFTEKPQQPNHQLSAVQLPDVVTAAQADLQQAAGSNAKSAAAAKAAFLRTYGRHYGYKGWLDKHWQQEVGYRFGQHMQHYLDFTGAALYTRVSA
jgi:hypothetical protein